VSGGKPLFPTAPEVSAGTAAAPPRLSPEELAGAQAESLAAPRRRYRVAARALFVTLDLVYGRPSRRTSSGIC